MKKEKSQQLIIFDMDGVLIDVSASYREVVRQTARAFFQPAPTSSELPDPLFSLAELASIKQSGGLNNDWDLTYFIIQLLFSLVEKPTQSEKNRVGWNGYHETMGHCNVDHLAKFLKSHKSPLKSLLKKFIKPGDGFIGMLSANDVGSGNVIKQIFQEFYLGRELFGSIYGFQPQVYSGEGYIHRERLLAERTLLEKLAGNHILAIATGRPKQEADFALDHHGIRKYFDAIYTLEDCLREEKRLLEQEGRQVALSKPAPYMLDAIASSITPRPLIAYYLGDMPDDMIAAGRSQAGFVGVGIVSSAPDKQVLRRELLRAGADYIIEDLKQVEEIVAV
ncbi:MAG: HAD hydrolase-like protein [Thermodesulfobacteriota bacterium]